VGNFVENAHFVFHKVIHAQNCRFSLREVLFHKSTGQPHECGTLIYREAAFSSRSVSLVAAARLLAVRRSILPCKLHSFVNSPLRRPQLNIHGTILPEPGYQLDIHGTITKNPVFLWLLLLMKQIAQHFHRRQTLAGFPVYYTCMLLQLP